PISVLRLRAGHMGARGVGPGGLGAPAPGRLRSRCPTARYAAVERRRGGFCQCGGDVAGRGGLVVGPATARAGGVLATGPGPVAGDAVHRWSGEALTGARASPGPGSVDACR